MITELATIEIADPAGLSCATKLQDRTDCDEAACNTVCPVTDDPSFQLWETCETNADNAAGSCEAYYDATSCVDSEMPDGGAAEAAAVERRQQGRLVDERTTRGVHQQSARLHLGECGGIDEAAGCPRERRVHRDEVGARQ